MAGPSVSWRTSGLQLLEDGDLLLRFSVEDLNMVINKSVADADLYRAVLEHLGHPGDWEALVLSTYAITAARPVEVLTYDMGGRAYLTAPVGRLRQAAVPIWPTSTFIDDVPDPFNDVHFDVVVAHGPAVIPSGMWQGKAARREARDELRPRFEMVLGLFDIPDDGAGPLSP